MLDSVSAPSSAPRPPVALPWMALAVFAANLGLGIIFPLIPHLAATSTAGPAAVGWIFSSYSLTLVVAQVLGGAIADRVDEARVLRVALWLYFLTLLGFTVSRTIPALMLNRALEGVAVGLIMPAVMKLVVRSVPPERRGRGIGFVMGLGGIGFIIGPLLGGYLAPWGLALPFLAAAVVAGVAATAATFAVPAAPVASDATPLAGSLGAEAKHFVTLAATPAFLGMVLPLMAFKSNFATLQAGLPLFGEAQLGVGMKEVSYLFVLTALLFGVAQPIAGRLADRFATGRLVAITLGVMGPTAAVMAFQHQLLPFVPAFAVYAACQSAGVLFAMKHIGDRVGESVQGKAFGLAAALGDVGMVVMPSVLLPLFAWRHEALFLALGLAMWAFAAAFAVLEPASRREKKTAEPPAA